MTGRGLATQISIKVTKVYYTSSVLIYIRICSHEEFITLFFTIINGALLFQHIYNVLLMKCFRA